MSTFEEEQEQVAREMFRKIDEAAKLKEKNI